MVALRKIEHRRMTTRSILVLWTVKHFPGIMGLELAKKLGFRVRGHVQEVIANLVRDGLVEDRRNASVARSPNRLYLTDAGRAVLDDIIPK